ncbi:MAG: response regulator transcription factor [Vulcanimicrobiaceae bacterium]
MLNPVYVAPQSGDPSFELVKKRAKPRVILLNNDLSIAFAEADAIATLSRLLGFPQEHINRLPLNLEQPMRRAVEAWGRTNTRDELLIPASRELMLRVSRLDGVGDCYFIAVFLEEISRREDLAGAARRYRFTRRELEVLTLMLGGLTTNEIAENLCLAETTVADYFKHLIKKTHARNRADMLARVLGWGGSKT